MIAHITALLAIASATTTSSTSEKSGKLNIYTPSWSEWEAQTARWSAFDKPTFSSIFMPETEDELSQGLAFLSRSGTPWLTTKAGGHGNARTMGEYQNVVQLNMGNFRRAEMNPDHSITLGGGTKMIDLIPTLHRAGREMTVGSFPCVGVHGVMLGGGMGRLMGKYGLISDAMQSARVALWNGTIVEASETENEDLFWGIRGAGQNFGVVVESTYKTWPDQGGMHYNADMVFTDESIDGVLRVAKEIIENGVPPEVFLIVGYVFDAKANSPKLIVNLVYSHNEKGGRALANKFASTAEGSPMHIEREHFSETMMDFAKLGSGDAVAGVCDLNLNNDLYTASSPTFFDVEAMKQIYESYGSFVRANPVANRSILLFETGSGEGIEAHPVEYTAYAHRGKMATNAIIQMTWDGDDEKSASIDAWGRQTRDTLARPEISGYDRLYAYINYANKDESLSALYGYESWRHEKLSGLKRKYDPHGFFNAFHAIPLKASDWTKAPSLIESVVQTISAFKKNKQEL